MHQLISRLFLFTIGQCPWASPSCDSPVFSFLRILACSGAFVKRPPAVAACCLPSRKRAAVARTEEGRGQVPFSSHYIKGLSQSMWTLIPRLRSCWQIAPPWSDSWPSAPHFSIQYLRKQIREEELSSTLWPWNICKKLLGITSHWWTLITDLYQHILSQNTQDFSSSQLMVLKGLLQHV